MGWLNRSASAVWSAGRWLTSLGRGDPQNAVDVTALLLDSLGYATKSGVSVNAETAMRVTAVLACARVLAEGVSQVPWNLMRKVDGSRFVAEGNDLQDIISAEPNEWDTSFTFRETLMFHAVLSGNAYAFINRVRGRIVELIPIPPGYVQIDRDRDYRITYTVSGPEGVIGTFTRDNIMHFRGPSWNGYTGMDLIGLSRDAVGLAVATEASQAALHKNGLRPSFALQNDKGMDAGQVTRVAAMVKAAHGGVGNVFRPLYLDNGWKLTQMMMTGVDAQHLETRRYQLEEICRAMRVFPQMAGHSDKTATFASAESFFIAHVVHSLSPWIKRFEECCYKYLLTKEERRQGYYFNIVTEGLLRGDSRARAAFYQVMVLTGIMTRNECRALEDLNALDGLDDPLVPLNMGVVGAVDGGTGSDGSPMPAMPMPNIPIAPLSMVNQMIGHNSGPPLDDMVFDAVEAHLPMLEAMGNRPAVRRAKALLARRVGSGRQNTGRVLSGENETLIRSASDNLTTVLSKLDSQED